MSPPVLGFTRPLAPQPVRPNDAPVLQPLQHHYPLKSTRSRRGTINAACRECRLKKLKRPSCQRCLAKGIDSCEYTVNPGETRFTALKRKNASLVTESDRMQKFIEALRSASPSQAQEMLDSLRTADASTQLLSTLAHFDPESQPLQRQESDSSVSSVDQSLLCIISPNQVFAEMGLNLLTRPPIPQVCPPNMERSHWTELRKTWRVLVFLETWLSSTLGYVSGLQLPKELTNAKNLQIDDETNLEAKVTTEMIRITIIKFDMLRLSLSFQGLSALMVQTITKELHHWYQNLPRDMRLTELAKNPEISFELRRTIYYVNFLYFGAQIMLLRRVLQSMHENNSLLAGDEAAVNDLIMQAKHAARESAKLFERLYIEGGIVQKCWVCIQKDVAAGQFHSLLSRFYAILYATANGQLKFGPDVIGTARELNELIRRPFKTQGQESVECCYLWQEEDHQHHQREQGIDDVIVRDVANAPNQSFCCDDSWQRIDGIKNDGMIHDLLSGIRPGRFLPGFESSAWH
ncbi:unnamed protein product [Aureobasidium mustum]|uniref:Zn(2)-C6 fungal-type domain-containing protein n=1 Tax=Aureobasidium mustum TaxID=2773714 RepID=A0A9N8JXE3_9PEZI|nr:unnamed protein product [Aureobasidium mustum]